MTNGRRKAKSFADLQRRKPQRRERDKVLIVTEGEKTEPDYFTRLIAQLGLTTAKVRVSGEAGSAPISVFEAAEAILLSDDDFEQVYIVFDRDDHSTYQEAISKTVGLSERDEYKGKTIKAITSFPCFEIWFALHVSEYSKPCISTPGGNSAAKNLVSELKGLPCDGVAVFNRYEKKGCGPFFDTLSPKRDEATARPERILRQAKLRGEKEYFENPSTRVHILVKALERLATQ